MFLLNLSLSEMKLFIFSKRKSSGIKKTAVSELTETLAKEELKLADVNRIITDSTLQEKISNVFNNKQSANKALI